MKNYLNYTNTYGINPFNGLNNLYDDATFEELREGLIDFDLPNRLKEMFSRIQADLNPEIKTKLSEFENDTNFITISELPNLDEKTDKGGYMGTSQDLKILVDNKLDRKMDSLSNAITPLEQEAIKTKLNITDVDISGKQDKLIAGTGVSIDPITNEISTVTSHNDSTNIQGGNETERFHIDKAANDYLIPIVQNDTIGLILAAIAVPPTYTNPSSSISNVTQNVEEGTSITINIAQNFIKNDAGAKTAELIRKNGTTVSATSSFTETLLVPLANTTYDASVSYAEGNVKNNNLGIPDPTGKILAGSVNSGTRTVTGLQKRYHGSVATLPASPSNGAANRIYAENLSKALKTGGANSFTLATGTANKDFIVLLPSGTTITSVIDQTNLNLNITSEYVLSTITIKNANGVDRSYNRYTFSPAGTYATSANHVITTT
jgi:hypothetical protein